MAPGTEQQPQTLLIGEALKAREPKPLIIDGNIDAVHNFISGRAGKDCGLQSILKEQTVIVVDEEKGKIVMDTDPNSPFNTRIIATLEVAPELDPWGINTTTTFNREQVVKLLKFNRLAFVYPDRYAEMLLAFQKFVAKTNSDHANDSDIRGNKNSLFNKSVESNLPLSFVLNLPIYKGKPAETFMVEIGQEVTDRGASFWFESAELKELLDVRKKEILTNCLKIAEGLVIIYQ